MLSDRARKDTDAAPLDRSKRTNVHSASPEAQPAVKRQRRQKGANAIATTSRHDVTRQEHQVRTQLRGGPLWDSTDYSCAYDVVLTSLLALMTTLKSSFSGDLLGLLVGNSHCAESIFKIVDLTLTAEPLDLSTRRLTHVRDEIRDILYAAQPDRFARRGPTFAAVSAILDVLFEAQITAGHGLVLQQTGPRPFRTLLYSRELVTATAGVASTPEWLHAVNNCPQGPLIFVTPPLWYFCEVATTDLSPKLQISLACTFHDSVGAPLTYRLITIIYLDHSHFTQAVIPSTEQMFFYDGQSRNGDFQPIDITEVLMGNHPITVNRFAHIAIYARSSRSAT